MDAPLGRALLGKRLELLGTVVVQKTSGRALVEHGGGFRRQAKLQVQLRQVDIVILAGQRARQILEAHQLQRLGIGNILLPLGQLDHLGPIVGLAGAGDELFQRIALGGAVVQVEGALHLKLQGRFIGSGAGALDVLDAAGLVARQVKGLGHNGGAGGIQSARLAQRFAVGDHPGIILGGIVAGELVLGSGRATEADIARLGADIGLDLTDGGGFLAGLVRDGAGLVDQRHGALVVALGGQGHRLLQRLTDSGAHGSGGRSRHEKGRAAQCGGAKEKRRRYGVELNFRHLRNLT